MGQPHYTGTLQAGFDVFITSLLLVSGLSSGKLSHSLDSIWWGPDL